MDFSLGGSNCWFSLFFYFFLFCSLLPRSSIGHTHTHAGSVREDTAWRQERTKIKQKTCEKRQTGFSVLVLPTSIRSILFFVLKTSSENQRKKCHVGDWLVRLAGLTDVLSFFAVSEGLPAVLLLSFSKQTVPTIIPNYIIRRYKHPERVLWYPLGYVIIVC